MAKLIFEVVADDGKPVTREQIAYLLKDLSGRIAYSPEETTANVSIEVQVSDPSGRLSRQASAKWEFESDSVAVGGNGRARDVEVRRGK